MPSRILLFLLLLVFLAAAPRVNAQCAICTRTAQQMGERPAKGLNTGIIYLAMAPLAIFGVIGYRWWKNNRDAG
ncbi:MAG: hypothetical protein Q8927_14350 [Bacteroidota bacterium]|nr:hypothetical protein [Bacteroidota bacterium]MDP4217380.1 hypothetical protein [Bacteroidota bacterium]MDP4246755.1 hypothetical protein [Bacteroidota bacterium]MDP4254249.1 hypothetical protein [Bacteroidota bacterium]MDP4260726.1 hypothetical protein [Bacteroidota bacterium]